MLDTKQRTGKEMFELSIYELSEEYKKSESEIMLIVRNAFTAGKDHEQHRMLESSCKEFKEYGRDLAEELMKRMFK